MEKYDTIISLGDRCTPAMRARRLGYKTETFPFDWLGTYDIGGLHRTIAGDMKDFFRYENLVVKEVCETKVFVSDDKTTFRHNHDFTPDDIEYDMVTPEAYGRVRAKYDRRVKRFLDVLKGGGKSVLFLRQDVERQVEHLGLADMIARKYPNLTYRLIVYSAQESGKLRHVWSCRKVDYYHLPVDPDPLDTSNVEVWKEFFEMLPIDPVMTKVL